LRPGFDLLDGADSVSVSGHKFLGVPYPCGVLVMRDSLRHTDERAVRYTGAADTTVTGSRSGHTPLMLWRTVRLLGLDGLQARAEQARAVAAYTVERLTALDWPAWRHAHAFTVVLRTPPAALARRWVLPGDQHGWSHLICMPGITRGPIDGFLRAFAAAVGRAAQFEPDRWRRRRNGGAVVQAPGDIRFDAAAWRDAVRLRWPRHARLAELLAEDLCDPDTGIVELPRSAVRRIATRTGMLPAAQRVALDQLAKVGLVTRIRSGDGTNLGAYLLRNTAAAPAHVTDDRQRERVAAAPPSGAGPPWTPIPPGNTAVAGTNRRGATASGRSRWRSAQPPSSGP
jgi:hypothetical protein